MIAPTLFELLLFQAERLQVTGSAACAALQDGRGGERKLGRKLLRVFPASRKKKKYERDLRYNNTLTGIKDTRAECVIHLAKI